MSQKEFRNYQENRFGLFCKTTIWNARTDNLRARKNREKRFSSLDALQLDVLELEQTEDTYVTYERVYRVKGIEVIVRDERLGEALQFILPNQRAVLLLSFFRDYCDIGRPDARFHDLRHSYAVASIRSGDDIKTVQGNLGHATAAFTLDVYGHVTDQMREASSMRMQAYIQDIMDQVHQ